MKNEAKNMLKNVHSVTDLLNDISLCRIYVDADAIQKCKLVNNKNAFGYRPSKHKKKENEAIT